MSTREHSRAKARSGGDAADDDLRRLVQLIARQAAQEAFAQFKGDFEALAVQARTASDPPSPTGGAAGEPARKPFQSPAPGERFLSVAEVAKRLDVSEKTVRRKIACGELPAHRVGKLIRVSESGLSACLAGALEGGRGGK